MNAKRLIISVVLGILISSIIFTLLITINMFSIDYTGADTIKNFSIFGQKYLKVVLQNHQAVKQVYSGVIAITGCVLSFITFVLLEIKFRNKTTKGGVKNAGKDQ